MATMKEGGFVTLDVSGVQVDTHYHESGPEGDDVVIFAQTGGAGTSAYMCWYLNMSRFGENGYRVLVPDFVGFGLTKTVSEKAVGINTSQFLLSFMEKMGVKEAHYVGNSMGSNAVTRLAIDYPARVKSLILTGGEPRIDTAESRALAAALGRTERMEFVRSMLSKPAVSLEDMPWATRDLFYDSDHPRIGEVADMRLETISRPGELEKEREGAFRQVASGRSNFESSDLKKILAPTYLIHGRDERFFYPKEAAPILLECAVKASFIIPDCSCTLLSRCGHWPQIEKAETFNALSLEFFKSLKKHKK